ncbi:MAG: BON domain-containing protein [Pirellulaceae bacterium]|nr:BON domain-containing protein [Pirellulaceae bacterium]
MVRLWIVGVSAVLVGCLVPDRAHAQTRTTQSSRTTGATTGATTGSALGATIGADAQNIGGGIPQATILEQGSTFGADLQIFGAAGEAGTGGARGTQGAARRGGALRAPTQPGQRRGTAAGLAVPVTMSLGFAFSPKVPANVGGELSSCLARLPNFGKDSTVRTRIENDVVVLEGTVATDHDRALAMQMVALQPGVRKIDNRLEVKPTTP